MLCRQQGCHLATEILGARCRGGGCGGGGGGDGGTGGCTPLLPPPPVLVAGMLPATALARGMGRGAAAPGGFGVPPPRMAPAGVRCTCCRPSSETEHSAERRSRKGFSRPCTQGMALLAGGTRGKHCRSGTSTQRA